MEKDTKVDIDFTIVATKLTSFSLPPPPPVTLPPPSFCYHSSLFIVGLLHGDMSQGDRDDVITSFKRREFPVLVASDVAG